MASPIGLETSVGGLPGSSSGLFSCSFGGLGMFAMMALRWIAMSNDQQYAFHGQVWPARAAQTTYKTPDFQTICAAAARTNTRTRTRNAPGGNLSLSGR